MRITIEGTRESDKRSITIAGCERSEKDTDKLVQGTRDLMKATEYT